MRIRFSTSNPQDMHRVYCMLQKHNNINTFTYPFNQNNILKEMNRLHTREEYMIWLIKSNYYS
jgi:tRNA-2-methylthio-N6-dimethylallyladenosine synthase